MHLTDINPYSDLPHNYQILLATYRYRCLKARLDLVFMRIRIETSTRNMIYGDTFAQQAEIKF